jgi:hypothetical protein
MAESEVQGIGRIIFYEGNGGSQNIVHSTNDDPGQDFQPNKNDEARSVQLLGVRAGALIQVYDSPSASETDDFCFIETKKRTTDYIVETFERSYEDDTVFVIYGRNNGLDGKVSRIRIS